MPVWCGESGTVSRCYNADSEAEIFVFDAERLRKMRAVVLITDWENEGCCADY